MPYREKDAAKKVEEKFVGDIEEEDRVVLWTNSAIRCRIVGVRMAWSRGCHHVSEVPKV